MESPWEGRISEEQLHRLEQFGIDHPLELALASLRRLTAHGFGEEEAFDLIVGAQHTIASISRGAQIVKRREARGRVSTGSTSLNQILTGGVKTGMITDFFGESGVGKTQMAFQLCVNATLPRDQGALEADVLFIDTAGTFRPERIAEMAEARGLKKDMVLKKILVSEVRSVKEQLELPQKARDLSTSRRLRLMIIDTLTENFLQTYGGEEGLIQRQSLLAQHLHDLALLALRNDMAVVVTNTVRSGMEETRGVIEVGGNVVAQAVHKKVQLSYGVERRVARVIQPLLPMQKASFRINKAGITD